MGRKLDILSSFITSLPKSKGKSILFFFTINIIGMCWYSTISGKPLDTSIAAIYGIVVAAYTSKSAYSLYENRKKNIPDAGD